MEIKRFRYVDIFKVELDGRISPRIPVRIGGITMGPGVSFGGEVISSGVDLAKHLGKDIAGYVENGVLVITGFYS